MRISSAGNIVILGGIYMFKVNNKNSKQGVKYVQNCLYC